MLAFCVNCSIFIWRGHRSSRFARLQGTQCSIAGKNLYIRFSCSTGDAMGMNMVSKCVQNVLDFLRSDFSDMDVIGISGKCSVRIVTFFRLGSSALIALSLVKLLLTYNLLELQIRAFSFTLSSLKLFIFICIVHLVSVRSFIYLYVALCLTCWLWYFRLF